MILVYGGVQPDTGDGRQRLPAEAVTDVENRVRRLLTRLRPSQVLGAAAAGADMIVADVAVRLGIPLRLVLPHDRDTFRRTSVTPFGGDWGFRYDRLLDVATVEEHAEPPDVDATYREHNRRMLERGLALATGDEQAWALVVRPPAGVPSSVSDDLAERAAQRGMLDLDLDPLATPESRPTAFVAMPYGKKYDPATRRTIDCDVVFDRVYVPVLEDLDLEWQRADLQTDSGVVHVDMIEALARSEVVLVDLATQNSNVAYELGLRHALADRATVLTFPRVLGVPRPQNPPFDFQPIRHVALERFVDSMTDAQAAEGIRGLKATVGTVLARREVDSPVVAWFERGEDGLLRRRSDGASAAATERDARETVRAALTTGSVEIMANAVRSTAAAPVSEPVRRGLHLQLGAALLSEKAYAEARTALTAAEPPPGDALRAAWLHQAALLESWDRQDDGADPTPRWDRADRLLAEVLRDVGDTEEICGIAAGIAKRRLDRALRAGRHEDAQVHLMRMTTLYRRGFRADPGYYAGVNLAAALRLGIQHFALRGGGREDELREALSVSRFLARREQDLRRDLFWPVVTLAELALHEHLLDGEPDEQSVVAGYLEAAAVTAPAAWRDSAADQLRFFAACGDDATLIGRLVPLLET